jgi:hypothetical protein
VLVLIFVVFIGSASQDEQRRFLGIIHDSHPWPILVILQPDLSSMHVGRGRLVGVLGQGPGAGGGGSDFNVEHWLITLFL